MFTAIHLDQTKNQWCPIHRGHTGAALPPKASHKKKKNNVQVLDTVHYGNHDAYAIT